MNFSAQQSHIDGQIGKTDLSYFTERERLQEIFHSVLFEYSSNFEGTDLKEKLQQTWFDIQSFKDILSKEKVWNKYPMIHSLAQGFIDIWIRSPTTIHYLWWSEAALSDWYKRSNVKPIKWMMIWKTHLEKWKTNIHASLFLNIFLALFEEELVLAKDKKNSEFASEKRKLETFTQAYRQYVNIMEQSGISVVVKPDGMINIWSHLSGIFPEFSLKFCENCGCYMLSESNTAEISCGVCKVPSKIWKSDNKSFDGGMILIQALPFKQTPKTHHAPRVVGNTKKSASEILSMD